MKILPIVLVSAAVLGFILLSGKRKNQLTVAEMKAHLIKLYPEMEETFNNMTSAEIENRYFGEVSNE